MTEPVMPPRNGSGLESRVSRIEVAIQNLSEYLQRLDTSIDALTKQMREMGRPPYMVIFGVGSLAVGIAAIFTTVAMTIAAAFATTLTTRLDKIEFASETHQVRFLDHISMGAHPVADAKIAVLEQENGKLDARLQMEMRLIADQLRTEITALDRRIQNEIRIYNEVEARDLGSLRKQLEREIGVVSDRVSIIDQWLADTVAKGAKP